MSEHSTGWHRAGVALLLAALVAPPAVAEIYKWVMPDGTIQYSDEPQVEGAEPVELSPLQTYEARPPPPPPEADTAAGQQQGEKGGVEGYAAVAITSPTADAVIRDNGGVVRVQLEVRPKLQSGHRVEIALDGSVIGSGRGLSVSLTNVDRGTHTVSASIADADGKPVASATPVTFHLKRAHVGS